MNGIAVAEHITYNILEDHYGPDIFTEPTIKNVLNLCRIIVCCLLTIPPNKRILFSVLQDNDTDNDTM